MEGNLGEVYIKLLNVEPENGKKLSEEELSTLCAHFQDHDLTKVREMVMSVFSQEAQVTKDWASRISSKTPINKVEQDEMRAATRKIADRMVKILNNLQAVSHKLSSPKPAEKINSPSALGERDTRVRKGDLVSLSKSGSNRDLRSLSLPTKRFGK